VPTYRQAFASETLAKYRTSAMLGPVGIAPFLFWKYFNNFIKTCNMRIVIFISALVCIPHLAFTQKKSDYYDAAERLMRYYNNSQADSFYSLFSMRVNKDFLKRSIVESRANYGSIISFRYWSEDTVNNNYMVFFVDSFDKMYRGYYEHPVGISLDKNKKICDLKWFRNNHPNLGE
jgi:hypothetical protein